MANKETDEKEVSGYLTDPFVEDIGQHFTNIELLSSEGFTRLYKAMRYGRWFVLKTMTDDTNGSCSNCQMLLHKELELLMRMQHAGVVQAVGLENIEDIGEAIIMEYVDGSTLDEWLTTNPDKKKRIRVAGELAEALAYVHSLGIVHRDLKPKNIMVTRNGERPKIIDFGLADSDRNAILKQPAGTLSYMSPEQAQSSMPDMRNDIYSLGLILEQMQLGRAYKKVVGRCLMPIDRRWNNMEEILAEFARIEKRRWPLVVNILVAMLLLALGLTTLLLNNDDTQETKVAIDSVRNELVQKQQHSEQKRTIAEERMKTVIATLNDSLKQLAATNEQLKKELNREEDLKKEALKALQREIAKSKINQHLDTLSHWNYRWQDVSQRIAAVAQFIYGYTENLQKQCDRAVADRIRETMLKEWQLWSNQITGKIELLLRAEKESDYRSHRNMPPGLKL